MQLTLIGHACWLIQSGEVAILTDPVLGDPFEDGTVCACPARAVELSALPPLTALFLSHRHPDHFHPDSLRRLPRELPVLLPPDPMLAAALGRLGFDRLRPLRPWQTQALGGLRLTPTPTAGDFPECGLLLQDDRASVFHQVDTPLNREAVTRLTTLAPHLDLHLAMYASQGFGWFDGVSEDLATTHGRNLSVARALGARTVVPSAAGFRFVDAFDWLNARLFPISEQRFVRDMARLSPAQAVSVLRPGDRIDAASGRVERAAAPFVRALEHDMARILPDLTAALPPLVDAGPASPGQAEAVAALVESELMAELDRAWPVDPLLAALAEDRVRSQLRVLSPDGQHQDWTLDFSTGRPVLSRGCPEGGAELLRAVTATALLEVAAGRRSCFYLRVHSRRSQSVLRIEPSAEGMRVEQPNVPDLLAWFLPRFRARQAGEEGLLRYYGLC